MKIKYNKLKSQRINYNFINVICNNQEYWWSYKQKRWDKPENIQGEFSNSSCPVKTVKAFKRRLREWSQYMPKGTKFILVSRWAGYDVEGMI